MFCEHAIVDLERELAYHAVVRCVECGEPFAVPMEGLEETEVPGRYRLLAIDVDDDD
jgi:hypothetical protein